MLTLLYHLLPMCGLFGGLAGGMMFGVTRWGLLGGIGCALAGGIAGLLLAQAPGIYVMCRTQHELEQKSTEQLREELRSGKCLAVNVTILTLRSRGVDISAEREMVLRMLTSTSHDERCRGFAALMSAFPDDVKILRDYSPADPQDVAAPKLARLQALVAPDAAPE